MKGKGEADFLHEANTDRNLAVEINANLLTVVRTTPWEIRLSSRGPYTGADGRIAFPQFAIYGRASQKLRSDGSVGIFDQTYHYNMDSWIRSPFRNIETWLGEPNHGSGTPFKINFYGSPSVIDGTQDLYRAAKGY